MRESLAIPRAGLAHNPVQAVHAAVVAVVIDVAAVAVQSVVAVAVGAALSVAAAAVAAAAVALGPEPAQVLLQHLDAGWQAHSGVLPESGLVGPGAA